MTPKEQYDARKAARECVGCGDPLPAEVTTARCDDCRKRNRQATYRARRTDEKLARARHYIASLYLSNPEHFKALAAERRLKNKLAGKCVDCPAPCLEDNARCAYCRDAYNESRRVEARLPAPTLMREVTDLTRVRVLRAAQHLDWFSTQELTTEILEIRDATKRNIVTVMIRRLVQAGRLERLEVPIVAGIRQSGSQFQFRITQAGRAEIRGILGGQVDARKFTSGRRTA
jgi:hypothetical protein